MFVELVEDKSIQDSHEIIERHTVSDEAQILAILAVEPEITESLAAWRKQEYQTVAERFYRIGEIGFRRGIPLQKVLQAIHHQTEQAVGARRSSGPGHEASSFNQEDQKGPNPITEFTHFAQYYVIRGYEDAVR